MLFMARSLPSPGIYAVMTFPVLSLTLAIFLSPEFGFFGLVVPTFKQTPFSSGRSLSCGERSFRAFCAILPFRNTWINVHLCARDAGIGCFTKAEEAFWKIAVAIDGRNDCFGAANGVASTEGRTSRRRNVRGIVVWRCCWLKRSTGKSS